MAPPNHAAAATTESQQYAPATGSAIGHAGQMSLLGWTPPRAAPDSAEQPRQLARVSGRLAESILDWCRSNVGREFHLEEITLAVQAEVTCAPDSVRRVLAQLRREGHVQVELLSRSASLYRVVRA